MKQQVKDSLSFLWHSCRHPKITGSQLPSGKWLSRAMVADVDPKKEGGIIELGPGTGVITRQLLDKGFVPERICAVELSPTFVALLKTRCSGVKVIQCSAFETQQWQHEVPFKKVQALVSSLPLMLFSSEQNANLLKSALSPNGIGAEKMIQFSYFSRQPMCNDEALNMHFEIERLSFVWLNLYPAAVWRYTRKDKNGK